MKKSQAAGGGGGCPFLANGDDDDVSLDVTALSPGLQMEIYRELGLPAPEGADLEAVHLSRGGMLGMISPGYLDPLEFFGGLSLGTGLSAGAARVASHAWDISPLWITAPATVLSIAAHVALKSSFSLGLVGGTAPILLADGIVALIDMLWPEPAAGPGATTESSVRLTGVDDKGGQTMGNLTRESMEEIQRVLSRLEPGNRAPAGGMSGAAPAASREEQPAGRELSFRPQHQMSGAEMPMAVGL